MPPRVLIIYGTTEGHTERVVRAVADALAGAGVPVDVVEAGDGSPPEPYAGVIVAASVHAGRYQRSVRRWVRTHAEALQRRPAAFVTVCLGILQHDAKARADQQTILQQFVDSTGWQPATVKWVAGALPYTHYGWLKRVIVKRIVGRAGGDTDTSRDYEYTDWADLRQFGCEFAARLTGGTAAETAAPAAAARQQISSTPSG